MLTSALALLGACALGTQLALSARVRAIKDGSEGRRPLEFMPLTHGAGVRGQNKKSIL